MLKSFSIKDFKSYRRATLPLAPLTVLIGANASGKSNAIEAMRLLSWLAQGHKLSTIQSGVQGSDQVVRGRLQDLGYRGAATFGVGCQATALSDELSIELTLRGDDLHVSAEAMSGLWSDVPMYQVVRASSGLGTDVQVAYDNFARGGKKPQLTCSDQFAIFTQLDSAARFGKSHQESRRRIPDIVRQYQKWLSNMLFLDPSPPKMRDYSFKTERRLKGDGENVSSVLHDLWRRQAEGGTYLCRDDILGFIQSLPEQDIEGLAFLDGPRGEVMVQLVETFGGEPVAYDATLLSDGTLRVLAIAAAMLSAPEESMVVIEEIDNGVHPSRAEHLMARIQETAERRELRVLLTTHNPALLDALPDEAIPHVVFCYRDPEDGSSRMARLEELTDYPALIAQGSLGSLLTSGTLERFVKHQRTDLERKAQALEWLEQMRGERPEAAGE